ncbi:4-hydroxy-3-methylbut-2-en-1-yl diphosphate synthase [Puteibacter caeruleilacunae]|nr:4-hydroxy-3-methylbut-2-en-1-yl diphosphate synthase [Puteibacter caeruleilacunae]
MKDRNFNYIQDLTKYERQKTSVVQIGNVPLGGNHPIRIQSMTDTDTKDTEATVEQIIRIVKAGAEYVRVATQGTREAENLKKIKEELLNRGYEVPLVADVHFNPKVADIAVKYVEKVRINPGNFYDKRAQFNHLIYTDEEYKEELESIEERFLPFLKRCKKYNTALRIGANQGSLSDRIMSRFGDTPAGMVESVMEFLRICKKAKFEDVVISIKSSNTRMMVYTVRMMNYKMRLEEMSFPLHIGVTEAGEGEDGRIKSAVGSSALLADGLGDTIRVSLTEHPENEVPFAQKLVNNIKSMENHQKIDAPLFAQTNPFEYERRSTRPVLNIGGKQLPVVTAHLGEMQLQEVLPIWGKLQPDYFYDGRKILAEDGTAYPIQTLEEYLYGGTHYNQIKFIRLNKQEFDEFHDRNPEIITKLKQTRKTVLILESFNENAMAEMRAFCMFLDAHICKVPILLYRKYNETRMEDLIIKASTDLGALLLDGYGDGICIGNEGDSITFSELKDLSFNILQASRMRVSKTEFISCPGCGRTLFDLHKATAMVKEHFNHLDHLKIGVMGCVVNGPGEMGDADYGFVGAGPNKVNLYKGQRLLKRHVPYDTACEELELIIKDSGDWKDPV